MRAIPLEVLASWPAPNYVDPVTRPSALYLVPIIGLALSTTFALLRFYSRAVIIKHFGVDDVLMILAVVGHPRVLILLTFSRWSTLPPQE
jgi:hypothetical protein